MRLLLDTHVALWAIVDSPRLSQPVRTLIADTRNTVLVSAASLWEIAIKFGLARGSPNDMPLSAAQALAYFEAADFALLAVTPQHAVAVGNLPHLHSDPFDRILVAQAITEPLRLVTHDPIVGSYSDAIITF